VCVCVKFWTLYRSDDGLANWPKLVNKGSVTMLCTTVYLMYLLTEVQWGCVT